MIFFRNMWNLRTSEAGAGPLAMSPTPGSLLSGSVMHSSVPTFPTSWETLQVEFWYRYQILYNISIFSHNAFAWYTDFKSIVGAIRKVKVSLA